MRLLSLLAALFMLAIAASPLLRASIRQSLSLVPRGLGYFTSSRAFSSSQPIYQSPHNMASSIDQTPLPAASSPQPQPTSPATPQTPAELPELSREDFRLYNRLAELMEYYVSLFPFPNPALPVLQTPGQSAGDYLLFLPFLCITLTHVPQHNHFRSSWTTLHTATTTNKRPPNTSIRQFINLGLSFARSLTMHHNIEEVHVFPMLGVKMPRFREQAHMKGQHAQIHAGLDKFEAYLEACRSGEKELRLTELGEIMEGFGGVLWQHLDDEVKELEAANMRKFWSREEMRRLNF